MNAHIKNFKIIFFIFLMSYLMSGCSIFTEYGQLTNSAEKSYQSGDYDNAVRYSSRALKLKPDYTEAQVILVESWPFAIGKHDKQVKELGIKKDLNSVRFRVEEYRTLIELNTMVKNLPPLINEATNQKIELKTTDYSEKFTAAEQVAADAYYNSANKIGLEGGIKNSRQAAKWFAEIKTFDSFEGGYKDSEALYEKYRQAGTKRIAILAFENKSGKSDFGPIGESLSELIIKKVMDTPGALEFLEIISVDEVNHDINSSGTVKKTDILKLGKELRLHEIITGQITQVSVVNDLTKDEERVLKKEIEENIGEEGKQINQTREISAVVLVSTIDERASIAGSYKIIDAKTAKLIETLSTTGKHIYYHQWGRILGDGDERAISEELKEIIRNTYGKIESNEIIINKAIDKLAKSLASEIIVYTKK
jgi:hypothetical protein